MEILQKFRNNKLAKFLTRWATGLNFITSEGMLANRETILQQVFDRETARKFSLLALETQAEVYAHEHTLNMVQKAHTFPCPQPYTAI